ncbi:MAG: hypothetical protein R3F19_01165 [Verrucomicrobiales bacterium]
MSVAKYQGLRKAAESATARRNAQTLSMVASSAQAAGNLTIEEAATMDDALAALIHGPSSGMGVFAGMDFKVSELTDHDLELAKKYLSFENGLLIYRTTEQEISTGYIE